MITTESATKRRELETLVAEAAEILKKQGRTRVMAPWLFPPENLDSILSHGTLQNKAAIVYTAHTPSRFIEERPPTAEAIIKAMNALALASEEGPLSMDADREYRQLEWALQNKRYESVIYATAGISAMVTDLEKSKKLRARLEQKSLQLGAVRVYRPGFGSVASAEIITDILIKKEGYDALKKKLENRAHELMPWWWENKAYTLFDRYVKERSAGNELLSAWLKEALEAAKVTVEKETIDGKLRFIPPNHDAQAGRVVDRVKAEHVPEYIERKGACRLELLVAIDLPEVAAAVTKQVRTSEALLPYLRVMDTTEGPITYVMPAGVNEVESFVSQAAAVLMEKQKPFLSRISPFKQKPQPIPVPEGMKKVMDAYVSGDYPQTIALAGMQPGAQQYVVSSRLRLFLQREAAALPNNGRLPPKQENRLWSEFKRAVRAYESAMPGTAGSTVKADVDELLAFQNRLKGKVNPQQLGKIMHTIEQVRSAYLEHAK